MTGSQKDDSRKGAKTQRKTQIRDIRRSSFGSNFVALRLCGKLCHKSTISGAPDSNTTTSMFELFKKNNAAFSRWLGLLLVLFVFYGTTIEAAHRHGKITSASTQIGRAS